MHSIVLTSSVKHVSINLSHVFETAMCLDCSSLGAFLRISIIALAGIALVLLLNFTVFHGRELLTPSAAGKGPRANTKIRAYNIDCTRGIWENAPRDFTHALRCVLETSEAPFSCMHTVCSYLKVVVFI